MVQRPLATPDVNAQRRTPSHTGRGRRLGLLAIAFISAFVFWYSVSALLSEDQVIWDMSPASSHRPISMPFRTRGYLPPPPPADQTFPIRNVDIDRG